jgi:hypothetical protein
MHYTKEELVERLGEPTEENARPNLSDPGKPLNVLRWECDCGATKQYDDTLWKWDPCERHKTV